MPVVALYRSLLEFFDTPTFGADTHPFDMLPWVNQQWCSCAKIEYPPTDRRIRPVPAVYEHLTKADRKRFEDTNQKVVINFLMELRNRIFEPGSDAKKVIDSAKGMTGHHEYIQMMEIIFDEQGGGVSTLVWDVMVSMSYTPQAYFKDVYAANEEAHKHGRGVPPDKLTIPPSGGNSQCPVIIARQVFGSEAIGRNAQDVLPKFARVVDCWIARNWENAKRRLRTNFQKRDQFVHSFETAYQEAVEQPRPGRMVKLADELRRWKDIAEITGEDQTKLFRDQEENLAKLWQSLGFSRDENGKVKRLIVKTRAKFTVADETAMRKAYEAYLEQFFPSNGDLFADLAEELEVNQSSMIDVIEQQDEQHLDLGDSEDIGVARFQGYHLSEMQRLLGIKDQFPFGERGVKDSKGQELKPPITPKCHQLVGVGVILQRMFVDAVGTPGLPTLLCDDVGLGKTIQIIGLFSMLVHIMELQSRSEPLPPLLQEHRKIYFNGQATITPKPFLLLMARGLVSQWIEQIEKFTTHSAFRVVVYSSNSKGTFFSPGGQWEKAVTNIKDPQRTIIIATFTAIASEVASCLTDTSSNTNLIAEARPENRIEPEGPGRRTTIFDQCFLVTAIDEIHSLRNVNKQYRAALRLTCNSDLVIGATATPVFTGAKDLLSSGRLIRIPEVIGDNGTVLTTRMIRSERKREENWSSKAGNASFASHLAEFHQSYERGALDQQKLLRKAYISRDAIDMAKAALIPAVVRRTGKSKNADGSPILSLSNLIESVAWTFLFQGERTIIEEFLQAREDRDPHGKHEKKRTNRDPKSQPYSKAVSLRDFLVKFKLMSFHIELRGEQRFWELWTAENWRSQASSKILMVVSVVEHHRDPKAGPMFWSHETGDRDEEQEAKATWKPASRKRKILLMCVYERPREILKKVFELIGTQCLEYDGSLTVNAREATIREFETNEDIDILMISNVGTTGLNIIRASVVLFSGLWSTPEEQQTIGRARRMGQCEDVFVYRLIARNTPDEILLGFANGKQVMLWQFVGKQQARQLLHSGAEESDQSDGEDRMLLQQTMKAQVKERTSLAPSKMAPRKRPLPKGRVTNSKKTGIHEHKDTPGSSRSFSPTSDDTQKKQYSMPELPTSSDFTQSIPMDSKKRSLADNLPDGVQTPGAEQRIEPPKKTKRFPLDDSKLHSTSENPPENGLNVQMKLPITQAIVAQPPDPPLVSPDPLRIASPTADLSMSDWDPDVDVTGISIDANLELCHHREQASMWEASEASLVSDRPILTSSAEVTYVDGETQSLPVASTPSLTSPEVTGISDEEYPSFKADDSLSEILPKSLSQPEVIKAAVKSVRFESTPPRSKQSTPVPSPSPSPSPNLLGKGTANESRAQTGGRGDKERNSSCPPNHEPQALTVSSQGSTSALSASRPKFSGMMSAFSGGKKK